MTDLPTRLVALVLPDICVVEDLAPKLHLSKSAVRKLLRRGVLPGRKLGRRWLIERHALLRALTGPDGKELHALRLVSLRIGGGE